MVPPMADKEHRMAWAIYMALNANRPHECAASCGCDRDPIVVIVRAMREYEETAALDEAEKYDP